MNTADDEFQRLLDEIEKEFDAFLDAVARMSGATENEGPEKTQRQTVSEPDISEWFTREMRDGK